MKIAMRIGILFLLVTVLFICYTPCIYASEGVCIDKVSIPDEVFRTVVLKKVDVDKDSIIDEEEDRKTTKLVLASESDYANAEDGIMVTNGIKDTKGLGLFHYLKRLEIWGDPSLKIDIKSELSRQKQLEELVIYGYVNLGKVVIPKGSKIQKIIGVQGSIEGLNVKHASCLKTVELALEGKLDTDFRYCSKLTYLDLYLCKISQLDLSKNVLLETVRTNSSELTKLNISQCKRLKHLECDGKLTKLNLNHNKQLESLSFGSRRMSELKIASKKINEVYTAGTKLKRIYINRSKKKVKITKDKCTKVIERIVKLPSKVKVSKKGKIVRWKKTKHAKKYQVFYSKKKNGTYKKMKTTSNRSYRLSKKGYVKVRGVTKGYGTNWYGRLSRAV